MRKVIIGLSLFCIGGLYAQQTNVYTDIQRYFNEGKVLHAQKKYAASTNRFRKQCRRRCICWRLTLTNCAMTTLIIC